MNRTLKSRLLIGLLASLGVLFVLGCVVVYWLQRELLYQDFDRQLHTALPMVLRQMSAQSFQDPPVAGEPIPGVDGYVARDIVDGRMIIQCGSDPMGMFPGSVPSEEGPVFFDSTLPDGRPARAMVERFEMPPLPDGAPPPGVDLPSRRLVVFVAAHTVDLRAVLRTRAFTIALIGVIGMACTTATVIGVVHRALRPLHPLGRQIELLGADALDKPITIAGLPGEIVPVVDRLNELLGRLDESFQREKAFTANAAHELLTPVAGVRSTLEVTLSRERSVEEYVQSINKCLEVIAGLERLVDSLLELSRLDGGQLTPDRVAVEIWSVTERQWNGVCEQARLRGLQWVNGLPQDMSCRADGAFMDRVMANLLDNASRYADDGGTVEVAGCVKDGRACVTVKNPAQELTQEDVTHMFDRFWEKDSARSQTGVHLGLGLSLVRRYLDVMDGSIRAELNAEHRLTVQFELPA